MDRDRRLTGFLRGQTDDPVAPNGFELNNPWRVCIQYDFRAAFANNSIAGEEILLDCFPSLQCICIVGLGGSNDEWNHAKHYIQLHHDPRYTSHAMLLSQLVSQPRPNSIMARSTRDTQS